MAGADRDNRFRRIIGTDENGPIYFLPWQTSFRTAMAFGLVGLRRWRLCYELPTNVVAADPEQCARAIRNVIDDVVDQVETRGPPSVFVGFSMGSVPATVLAGRYRTKLWSFASADRGDLMIWQSPAARAVRAEAETQGFTLRDFTRALQGLHPVEWVDRIDPASRFSVGLFDRYVPWPRRSELVKHAAATVPIDHFAFEPLGHLGVMALSPWRQRQWLWMG